jgi:hypothetical protein
MRRRRYRDRRMPKTVQLDGERLMKEDPEEFHREYRAWQTRVLKNMKKSGAFKPL